MRSLLQKFDQLTIWHIIAIALLLRIPFLNGSFWLDEAAQALESIRPLYLQFKIAEDFQPPLLHLILHFATYVSRSEWWLRLFGALLPGLVTIYYSYRISEHLFNKTVALVVASLLATSSFHIFYSQELRPYSLSAMWTTLSWYFLLGTAYTEKKFRYQRFFGFAALTACGLYTTYLYPYVLISQAIYVVWKERQYFKSFIGAAVIGCLLFVPWLPSFYEQLQVGQALRKSLPGWEAVVSIPQLKSIPLTFGKFLFGVLDLEITISYGVIFLLILSGCCVAIWKIWNSNRKFLFSKEFSALLCWLFIPLVTSWLTSFAVPIVQPKRVLYLLPAFYMMIVALIFQAQYQLTPHTLWQKITIFFSKTINPAIFSYIFLGTLTIIMACNLISTLKYYSNPLYQRENWRKLHVLIQEKYPDDTAIIFAFYTAFAPWEWYDGKDYPVFAIGSLTTTPVAAVEANLKRATEHSYLIVFDYLRDLTDPNNTVEAALENLGYQEKEVFGLPGIGFVRVFARQEDVLS